ncbi:MAG: Slp family lipoprotein [Candidatus Manganitrophaceae bacterium]
MRAIARNIGMISLWVSAFLLLVSCGPKVIPEVLEERIDRRLTFEEVKENPEAHLGRLILIGGEIIETRNFEDKTEIEVLQKPLGSDRAPIPIDESGGRFILIHPTFLDPVVFKSGRRITVVGVVQGKRMERIGQAEGVVPVLGDEHIYLWPSGRYQKEPSINIGFGFGAIFGR